MKKMHWSGIVATGLISMSTMAGCSGDDPQPVGTAGTSAGGSSSTAGSATGGSSTGGTAAGVQLDSPNYHVELIGADATPPTGTEPAAYKSGGCSSCHGDSGEGNVIGPEIRFTPKDYFTYAVRNGRKTPKDMPSAMLAFPASQFSDADLDAVSTWLNAQTKPTTGSGLYKAMCGNCHGPMTPTGGSAPVNIQGIAKTELTKYVRMGNGTDVANRKEYMPKYDTTLLTDAELDLIGQFIGAK